MWWTAVAFAQEPAAPVEPVQVAAVPWAARVTGYRVPRPDPAWLIDEAPWRSCTVAVRLRPDGTFDAEAAACPEPMVAAMVDTTRSWSFAPVEPAVQGPTAFEVRYVVRYEAAIGAMTIHAEVDPGEARAFAGDRGSPGLKLVHPAALQKGRGPKGGGDDACRLRLTVDGRGRVARTEVLECPEPLREAAEKATRKWRYTPRIEDGVTMPEVVDVDALRP